MLTSLGNPMSGLFHRKIPPSYLRLLLNLYTKQSNTYFLEWRAARSDVFVAKNGVKQGGVISPLLFCTYIDGLLQLLCKSKVGCFIGNVFVGALSYADDLVLLVPTARAMRLPVMLHVCDQYAIEYNMVFNACKSKCFVASRHKQPLAKSVKPAFYIGLRLSMLKNGLILVI